jgi:hypothetical protein
VEAWSKDASLACNRIVEWSRVALNPTPAVRAAMFLADPWAEMSADDALEREQWEPQIIAAAEKIIAEAKTNVPDAVAERSDTLAAALQAADAAASVGDPGAFLAAVSPVADLLGGDMKVQHGS